MDIKELLEFARTVAEKGGAKTLEYFRNGVEIDHKTDDSPVTVADRQAELVMREIITEKFPDHGIIGEEFGKTNEDSDIQWILDPIDGTISFIHGIPTYTTLIGITIKDEPVIGIIHAPALGEMTYAATGLGAFHNNEPCKVRKCNRIEDASFITTDLEHIHKHNFTEAFDALLETTKYHRTWGDAYGHSLVATGRADIMFDPILKVWDAAALLPVIKESGGVFCTVSGEEDIYGGNGISVHPDLKEAVLEYFK